MSIREEFSNGEKGSRRYKETGIKMSIENQN
jgi:hypothetical protein